ARRCSTSPTAGRSTSGSPRTAPSCCSTWSPTHTKNGTGPPTLPMPTLSSTGATSSWRSSKRATAGGPRTAGWSRAETVRPWSHRTTPSGSPGPAREAWFAIDAWFTTKGLSPRSTEPRSIRCSMAAPSPPENAYHVAMPSVTLSDVAREARASLATASRAINGSANRTVRPELGERVLAAAARLGYSPAATAQAMARGRTTTLGLTVHDIADPYFASIAAGVSNAAEEAGLMMALASTGHRPQREAALLQMLQSQRARAIVIAGGRQDDAETTQALREAIDSYRSRGGT